MTLCSKQKNKNKRLWQNTNIVPPVRLSTTAATLGHLSYINVYKMKIAIIGCGNMGGAIARGLAANNDFASHNKLAVSNRSYGKLEKLKTEYPAIEVSTDNKEVAKDADIVIFAVKPWLLDAVVNEMRQALNGQQIIVSVVAGVPFEHLGEILSTDSVHALFRVIPNTAIALGESMTVIAAENATESQIAVVSGLFNHLGKTLLLEERLMGAATSLGSCGTAFALRYIRAAMEAGIELGLYPEQAKTIVAQTVKGAAELLLANGTHPETEIDKVTTPGGITIKGLNRMEACGFTNAVIEAHKASVK